MSFLQKALSLDIDAPDQEWQVDRPAGFTTAIEGAKDFHNGFFTVVPPDVSVNSVSPSWRILGEGPSPNPGGVPKRSVPTSDSEALSVPAIPQPITCGKQSVPRRRLISAQHV